MEFTEEQLQRYARQIVLPEIGGTGQARLLAAKVLVIGAGGLGSPLLLYLAAAGVGTLGVVDDDSVELSNLQRQVLHDQASLGRTKVESALDRLRALNAGIELRGHVFRLTAENAQALIATYDLVADGSDSFATRLLVADACRAVGRPLVSASAQGLSGQLTTFKAHLGAPHPCFHCLHPEAPAAGALPSCAQGGVLGAVTGVMGTLQAVEVVKELLGFEADSLSGTLLLWDAMGARFDRLRIRRAECCGSEHAR